MPTATSILTDLQRIELAFPVMAMLHVLDHGADPTHPRVRHTRTLLVATVDMSVAGLTRVHERRLRSRLDRVLRVFLSPLIRGSGRVDIVGLVVWQVLGAVLDDDILVLSEGTPFSDALEAMRPALERALREPAVAAEVAHAWPEALCRLQTAGLYAEVGREWAAAA